VSWEVFARREHAPLSARLLQEAQQRPFFGRVTGIPTGLRNHAWICDRICIPTVEIDALRDSVAALVPADDWGFLEGFTGRCSAALAELEEVARDIADDESLRGDSALPVERALVRWLGSYRVAMAFVPVFRVIDRVLSSYIPEDRRAEFIRADSSRPTEEALERAALSAVARRLARGGDRAATGKEASALIAAHVERYGWLGTRWHLGRPFAADGIRQRVAALLATSGSDGPPVFDPRSKPESETDSRQRVVGELVYLRSHRAEAVNHSIWIAAPLFESIARRAGVAAADVPFFLPDELLGALAGVELDRGLAEVRRTAFATVLSEDAFTSATGVDEVDELQRRLGLPAWGEPATKASQSDGAAPLLRGVVASPGRARGRVRLIRGNEGDVRVETGDILVTTMTYPSLVASMQRSAAIVTDDGGLLSHAAVTARELEKPCLIDTARATEVLSDGDFVEVDCEVGVVNYVGRGVGGQSIERSRS
jgi:phosphohistidine swiveling domain-containing protein